ncbi:MAG: aldehyde dehydrogenase, partial [Arthrobacter sp.]|nr:aldehyde dehydrogenase [Arthrobacter sp.]
DKAAAAFEGWSKVGPNERRMLLLRAADQLEARADELIQTVMLETGAAAAWGGFNVHLAAKMLREAGAITTQITGEVIPSDRPGVLAMGIRQPAGVSLGIAPWNAPIILATRAVAVPLACGNTVVLKGSEACPRTHQLLAEIIASAGFPDGVVNVVTNAPQDAASVVEALILHKAVRRVNFTGSTHVGRIIGRICGEALKPVLLELGGKSPLLVLDDADLDLAVNAAAFGAFMNSGQICMSTERIIVQEKVADEFVKRLSAKAAALPVGNPRTEKVVLGSVISREAVDKVQGLIQDAVGKGAVLAGGAADRTFMAAAVLDRVSPDMKIYHDESFGPVVSVIRVKDDEEAIRTANDTEYGLSAAVITTNITRGIKIARRIESGICHINGPTVQDEAQVPFGGVKASGVGRFGGRWGIEFFSETRWLSIETEEPHFPF